MKLLRNILLSIALVLFAISLCLPAFLDYSGLPETRGWEALFFGWAGMGRWYYFGWFANPLALTSLLLIRSKKANVGFVIALGAFLVSLISLYAQHHGVDFVFDGFAKYMGALGTGFYVWSASLATLVLAAAINSLRKNTDV